MSNQTDPATQQSTPCHHHRRTRRRRFGLLATLLGAGLLIAIAGFTWGPGSRCGMGHRSVDPEDARAHLEFMVGRAMSKVDASADQQARVQAILDRQLVQMLALRDEHRGLHDELQALLTADTIDRTALERLRANKLERAQAVSLELTDTLASVAEVLTPEQRRELAQWMESQHRR